MARISGKNQLTLPAAVLAEAGLRSGDEVVIEVVGDGEVRIRRAGPQRPSATASERTPSLPRLPGKPLVDIIDDPLEGA